MANTGNKNHGTFANDPKTASEAGRAGGQQQGQEKNRGNLATNPDKTPKSGGGGEGQ